MAHKNRPFRVELESIGVDPESWASARAGESDQVDYMLARDLEELVESAAYDRVIELNDNEGLLDVWSIVWSALSRWPLTPAVA